jgi:hypothetical protein
MEETVGPGEGATFCAIWSALPVLNACSLMTPVVVNTTPSMRRMMRARKPSHHRPLLGRKAYGKKGADVRADFDPICQEPVGVLQTQA